MADEPETGQDPVEQLLDILVYAPLGFVVDARRVVPELAERGRAQAGMAKMIGEFAVSWGNTKLQGGLADAQDKAVDLLRKVGVAGGDREPAAGAPVTDTEPTAGDATAPTATAAPDTPSAATEEPAWLEGRSAADEAEAAGLAIPDYDNLSASQVVPRLDGLTPDELEAVRSYERRHRHRKTILNRVAQLQAGTA